MKTVIFNVGGALSCYLEGYGTSVVVDLGKSESFSPVDDFLVPLFEQRNNTKGDDGKYQISQLIISHPHKDHISDIKSFDEHFNPYLLTTPNSNSDVSSEIINWSLLDTPDDDDVKYLKKMLTHRQPPLRGHSTDITISYLYPKYVENDEALSAESYNNNISIATFIKMGGYGVFFPGDIQKEGMTALLDKENSSNVVNGNKLRTKLKYDGVDFLVCPHHGLRSAFSTVLFSTMKDGKTQKLNIISEKETSDDDTRIVDSRYSTKDYCLGDNNLSTEESPVYERKTTNGHVFIADNGDVTINKDINEILKLF